MQISRLKRFRVWTTCVIFVACPTFLPSVASAGPIYTLDATSVNPLIHSGFSLTYDDINMDMLVSLDELQTFSGVVLFGVFIFDEISAVPFITDIAAGFTLFWQFRISASGTLQSMHQDNWTYVVTPDAQQVPAPATITLFFLGLVGLGITRLVRDTHS